MRNKTKTPSAWINELPRDVKAKLSALCRHYGDDLRQDLAEIVRAYYTAKKMSLSRQAAELLDQATTNTDNLLEVDAETAQHHNIEP